MLFLFGVAGEEIENHLIQTFIRQGFLADPALGGLSFWWWSSLLFRLDECRDSVIENPFVKVFDHSLMLFLHEVPDDSFEFLHLDDIGIIDLLGRDDVAPIKEMGNDVGHLNPGVLSLDVKHVPSIRNVIVQSEYHCVRGDVSLR